jgi:hypothetical protein
MTHVRREVYLIVLGVVVLALALIVLIRNQSPDDELLAVIGLVGGLAIIVTSLPDRNHGNDS